jgi:hypothetical protein
MPARTVDLSVVRAFALRLPNVEDASSARGAGFKVGGRLLACEALHKSAEPNSLMVRVSFDERVRLLAGAPDTYYVTEHYLKHPAVLVRLSRLGRDGLRNLLATAWIFVSEKSAKKVAAKPVAKRRMQRAKPRGKPRLRS